MTGVGESIVLHASAVAIRDRGVLITGPAGSGKSALAADLVSRGGVLIADDRTVVQPGARPGGPPRLAAPTGTSGLLELRGVGILRLSRTMCAPANLIVDMSRAERDRLPETRFRELLGRPVRLVFGKDNPNLAAAATIAATVAADGWLDPATHAAGVVP